MSALRKIAIATVLIGILGVILISWSVGVEEILDSIIQANPVYLLGYIITSIIIAMVLTYKWQIILTAQKCNITFNRLFAYRLVGYSVSYLTPTAHVGGEPLRAYLLKRDGVPTKTAVSAVVIDKSIEIMTDILFFFFGALIILNSVLVTTHMKQVMLGISLLLILIMGVFIGGVLGKGSMFVRVFHLLQLHKIKKWRGVERNLAQIEKEIELFYRHQTKRFIAIILLMIGLWGLMYMEYRFALLIFGQIASPAQIFIILTGVGIAYSLPIPAALGALELGQLSAAKVLGLSAASSIALAFLVRTRDLIWTIMGLIILGTHQLSFTRLAKQQRELDKKIVKGEWK